MFVTQKNNLFSVGICKIIVKSHWQTVLFAILYIVGLSVGAVFFFVAPPDTYKQLCRLSGEYLLSRSQWESSAVFLSSFLSVFWFLLLFFLLGILPLGRFLICPLIGFRGLGNGIAAAAICSQNDMERSLLLILFLQAVIILLAGKIVWSEHRNRYWTGFLGLTVLSAAAAVLDVFLSL